MKNGTVMGRMGLMGRMGPIRLKKRIGLIGRIGPICLISLILLTSTPAQYRGAQGWIWQNPLPQGNAIYAVRFG